MYQESLTGRARARPGWFGRQVLQVEILRASVAPRCPPRPGLSEEERAAWNKREPKKIAEWIEWRDAAWNDLQRASLTFSVGV